MNIQEFENYIKEKNKKHIIFDFDGTICKLLIDWNNWCREIEDVASHYSIGVKPSEFGFQKSQNVCIEKGGKEARDKILEISYRNEKDYYSGYELLPAALPLIEIAKKYARLYVWTSNDQRTVMPILTELGIADLFGKIIARNDVNFIKPNSEGFSLIHDKNNQKSDYLLIGDSKADDGAAKDSGIDFINIEEFNVN